MTTQDYFDLLGSIVRDKITGFEGVVESIGFDLYGCVQAVVKPPIDKAKPTEIPDGRWFDCKRLVVIGARVMDVPQFEQTVRGKENGPADKPRASGLPIK